MTKKRRLGRGLDSLISVTTESTESSETAGPPQPVAETRGAGERTARDAERVEEGKARAGAGGTGKAKAGGRRGVGAESRRAREVGRIRQAQGGTVVAPSEPVTAGEAAGTGGRAEVPRNDTIASGVTRRDTVAAMPPEAVPGAEMRMVKIGMLVPNRHQPRGAISERSVMGLADSVRQTGILQPITVRKLGVGYEVVTGERRWRAAELAGLAEVPVVVRDVSDEEMLELALVENIQREDLNAIDRALAYQEYCEKYDKRPEEVGQRLGEDRSTVVNFLRLLELPAEVQGMVAKGLISAGHGRSLLGLGSADKMALLARTIVRQGLSVRAVEETVRRSKREGATDTAGAGRVRGGDKTAHIRDLEGRLSLACGTKVLVDESRRRGQGKIVIEYYSLDDFDRIAGRLGLGDAE